MGIPAPVLEDEALDAEFDLDVRVLEISDASQDLISLTDDNCGSTCSSPCATASA